MQILDVEKTDRCLDPARGGAAFYDQCACDEDHKHYCEIDLTHDDEGGAQGGQCGQGEELRPRQDVHAACCGDGKHADHFTSYWGSHD